MQVPISRAPEYANIMFWSPENVSIDAPGSRTFKLYLHYPRKGLRVQQASMFRALEHGSFPYILPAKAPAWWRSLEVQIIQKHICVSECFQGIKGH